MPSFRNPLRHLAVALATMAVALVAAAPAAQASLSAEATVQGNTVFYDLDLENLFAQDLVVSFNDEQRYVFTEQGSQPRSLLKANADCRLDSGKVLSCKGTGVTQMIIATELFDDSIDIGPSVKIPVSIQTGQGGDTAKGGEAGDRFLGGVAQGLGNDTFEGRAGNDTFEGELQADVMKGGENGADGDTLDYGKRFARQTASLDNEPNDGDPSDISGTAVSLTGADNALEIENIIGGSARDTLTGNDGPNVLNGGNSEDDLEGRLGADTFIGGKSNDKIAARSPTAGVPDPDKSIECGDGQDRVIMDAEDVGALPADPTTCEDIDCGGCEIPTTPGGISPAPAIVAADPPGGANDADEGTGPGGGGPLPDPDGPGPQPAPAALPPQVQIITGGVVPLKANGRIPVRIICLYRADRCKGSLTLKAKTKLTARIGGRTRTFARNATIATANLAPIRWGNSAPVQLQANALFRAILPLLGKPNTKVQAVLVSQDTAGGANAPSARVTGDLTVAAKRARRGR